MLALVVLSEYDTVVLNCDANAGTSRIFHDVSFAKLYDVNSAPNSS